MKRVTINGCSIDWKTRRALVSATLLKHPLYEIGKTWEVNIYLSDDTTEATLAQNVVEEIELIERSKQRHENRLHPEDVVGKSFDVSSGFENSICY